MSRYRKMGHTAINVILIAMILLLGYVMDNGITLVGAGNGIRYKSEDKSSVSLQCVIPWDGQYVKEILETLKSERVTMSFVISGSWAEENPALLCEIVEDGHTIITCGMNYNDTATLNISALSESIKASVRLIESLCHTGVSAYFCPTDHTAKAMRAAKAAEIACVRCTMDLLAGRGNENDIIARARWGIEPASIVSFTPTAAMKSALPEIIATYKMAGLKVK